MAQPARRLVRPALFVCDLQEKFRSAIHEYAKVISTTQKMLRASQILDIPVFATTQLRSKLGETCAELGLDSTSTPTDTTTNSITTKAHIDKSAFSMLVPSILTALSALDDGGPRDIVVLGIEAHICVTQTTLDLLRAGHRVYVLADGVSSCNAEEVPIALARLRAEGAVVTSSESWLYECMGDAAIPEFREVAKLVKEFSGRTKESLQALCKI
ncbi:hypothetical protein LTR28_012801 [Elasticomyces elasticus]|nr:hypothetical protein LTR28_012801 [Elasticomyces elasticus]